MSTLFDCLAIPFLIVGLSLQAASAEENDWEAIGALLTANGARAQYEQMLAARLDQANQVFLRNLGEALEERSLSKPQKERALQLMRQNFNAFSADAKEAVARQCNWDDALKTIYAPIYRKRFSVEEVKMATTFYSSELGKKLVAAAPPMAYEATAAFERAHAGDIQSMVREQVRARLKAILEEVAHD